MSKTRRHEVTNKLKHAVRNKRMWRMRVEKDRKKEWKKIGNINDWEEKKSEDIT